MEGQDFETYKFSSDNTIAVDDLFNQTDSTKLSEQRPIITFQKEKPRTSNDLNQKISKPFKTKSFNTKLNLLHENFSSEKTFSITEIIKEETVEERPSGVLFDEIHKDRREQSNFNHLNEEFKPINYETEIRGNALRLVLNIKSTDWFYNLVCHHFNQKINDLIYAEVLFFFNFQLMGSFHLFMINDYYRTFILNIYLHLSINKRLNFLSMIKWNMSSIIKNTNLLGSMKILINKIKCNLEREALVETMSDSFLVLVPTNVGLKLLTHFITLFKDCKNIILIYEKIVLFLPKLYYSSNGFRLINRFLQQNKYETLLPKILSIISKNLEILMVNKYGSIILQKIISVFNYFL